MSQIGYARRNARPAQRMVEAQRVCPKSPRVTDRLPTASRLPPRTKPLGHRRFAPQVAKLRDRAGL